MKTWKIVELLIFMMALTNIRSKKYQT